MIEKLNIYNQMHQVLIDKINEIIEWINSQEIKNPDVCNHDFKCPKGYQAHVCCVKCGKVKE